MGSRLHFLWTKVVAKYMEGIFPFCLGERKTSLDLGETRSKLTLTVSPRENLISNS
jgi:hypothetical protein